MMPPSPLPSPANRRALLNNILVDTPRLRAAHQAFDFLVELRDLEPNLPRRCIPMIAPSQSGKTKIIDSYMARLNTPAATENGNIPALKVELQDGITRRQFAQSILFSFADLGYETLAESGTELTLIQRAKVYLAKHNVRILFIDEFHHLVYSENQRLVRAIGEMVKSLLNQGPCSIVVAGIRNGRRPFYDNEQLAFRSEPPIHIPPFDPGIPGHVSLYRDFLSDYLVAAERVGAAGGLLNLLIDDMPACIWEVSRGVGGAACDLIKIAVQVAADNGRWDVCRHDLIAATDHFVFLKLYDRNPFREGLGPIRPADDE
jgi:hypothetical protein